MRILYLNPGSSLGGAEMSLLDILETLGGAQSEWQTGLITTADGPLAESAAALGIPVQVIPLPPAIARLGDAGTRSGRLALLGKCIRAAGHCLPYLLRLRAAIRNFDPDVIHTNGFKMHVLGLWARARHTPVIWHIRDYVSSRPVMRWLLKAGARDCRAAVCNSLSVCRDLESVCGPQLPVFCLYNGIDLGRYTTEGEKTDLDGLAGLEPAGPEVVRVGLVATLARWKGHEVFLHAIAQLPADLACRAYVIGGSIYQTEGSQYNLQELRELARTLNIAGKVGFTGFVRESAQVIRALDIVVHASTQPEPFGRLIAEAMACGKPVITSGTGGAAELVTHRQNALVHVSGDSATLAERIAELTRDPQLRLELGRAGRATAESRFDRSRLVAQLLPIYRWAVTRSTDGLPAALPLC
jgi:glycosyltransferase involved in cell wall biosynthesis